MIGKRVVILLAAAQAIAAGGCEDKSTGYGPDSPYSRYYDTKNIVFLDDAASNAELNSGLTSLSFISPSGEEREIRSIAPGKNLVVIVTRGNTVPICPYCSTQISQYIRRYQELKQKNTEVVAVYPIETGEDQKKLRAFLGDVKQRLEDPAQDVPFPVLLDVELKGVNKLGIRKDLSKPATYVVSANGEVRYAYVGAHLADRPSVDVVLKEIESLPATDEGKAAASGQSES